MPRSLFAFLLLAPLATGCLEDDLGRSPRAETDADAKGPGGRTAPNGPSDPACDWGADDWPYCLPACPLIFDSGRYVGFEACTADTAGRCFTHDAFDSVYECRAGGWEKLHDFGWHEDYGINAEPHGSCAWEDPPSCDCYFYENDPECRDAGPGVPPDAGGQASCPAPPGYCQPDNGLCVDQGAPSPDWCDAGVDAAADGDVGAPDDLDLGVPVADGDVRECPAPPGWCTETDGSVSCVDQGAPAARWCDAGPTP